MEKPRREISVVYHVNRETGSSAVCTNGSSVRIGRLPFTQQPFHFRGSPGRVRPDHHFTMAEKNYHWYVHYPFGYFGWKFWTTFQDVPFIPDIFRLVEAKLSHYLHSDFMLEQGKTGIRLQTNKFVK